LCVSSHYNAVSYALYAIARIEKPCPPVSLSAACPVAFPIQRKGGLVRVRVRVSVRVMISGAYLYRARVGEIPVDGEKRDRERTRVCTRLHERVSERMKGKERERERERESPREPQHNKERSARHDCSTNLVTEKASATLKTRGGKGDNIPCALRASAPPRENARNDRTLVSSASAKAYQMRSISVACGDDSPHPPLPHASRSRSRSRSRERERERERGTCSRGNPLSSRNLLLVAFYALYWPFADIQRLITRARL